MSQENIVSDMSLMRLRKPTAEGAELYIAERDKRLASVEKAWRNVSQKLQECNECPDDMLSLRNAEKTLSKSFNTYRAFAAEYTSFLMRTNTSQSHDDLKTHTSVVDNLESLVEAATTLLDGQIKDAYETMSHASKSRSRHSKSSNASSISYMLTKKRMEAEKAKENIEFAKKEAQIRHRQAQLDEDQQHATAQTTRKKIDLDTDLALLNHEKDAALAEAELRALEAPSEDDISYFDRNIDISLPAEDRRDRTQEYVNQHIIHVETDHEQQKDTPPVAAQTTNAQKMNVTNQQQTATTETATVHETTQQTSHAMNLNAELPEFRPRTVQNSNPPQHAQDNSYTFNTATNELTRFMLRKELLFSRLVKYDDRPESYAIWKSGFQGIMQELQVNPAEEMDLLVKWLGNDSARHAHSLRAANAGNPARALTQAWDRLDERYGSPEMIETALKTKLNNFPRLTNKDSKKLYELSDMVTEMECIKENDKYRTLLSYFDSSSGVIPIVNKLPYSLQDKWTNRAWRYKQDHKVPFPPFRVFAEFLREASRVRNDPSFNYETRDTSRRDGGYTAKYTNPQSQKPMISAKKTDLKQPQNGTKQDPSKYCPIHGTKHTLNKCKSFRAKPIEERRAFLKENGICFRCCESTEHFARECKADRFCDECRSDKHVAAIHMESYQPFRNNRAPENGGEKPAEIHSPPPSIKATCTQVCGFGFTGKSCAKTVLVNVYPYGQPEKAHRMYAILDEQSNASLARTEFFDMFDVQGAEVPYSLSSCSGRTQTTGRQASGFVIEALDGTAKLDLPGLFECDNIPNFREEIPTPEVTRYHPHLSNILIPPLDDRAEILLLIGRDLTEVHHVLEQRIGPRNSPYAHRLSLGWVIVGEVCLGRVHKSEYVNIMKTGLLDNGRSSILKPCQNNFEVKQPPATKIESSFVPVSSCKESEDFGSEVFERSKDDNKQGTSIEDRKFLEIMDKEFEKQSTGNWVAPLPFRSPRPRLPNNRSQALKRAQILDQNLTRNEVKRRHFVDFMQRVLDNGHAEPAPALKPGEECWYLPIFGVYHPRKPDQIRAVFDSSAQFNGVSLNQVLLSGPDMTNSLLGVLLRFRKEPIAVTADIEQMFHCFMVTKNHRNFLRFFWYRNNDLTRDIIEYRMRVHLFGNSPSPAVASYGLRRSAKDGELEFGSDVVDFVENNFYVDDGLASFETVEKATDLLKRTQTALKAGGNLRLHKIASNSSKVMESFPCEDLAKDLKDLSLETDTLPSLRSLGQTWDLTSDSFTFRVSAEKKSCTRRGILSTINSIFDPIGFAAPVIIQGKWLLRDITAGSSDWDTPLPT